MQHEMRFVIRCVCMRVWRRTTELIRAYERITKDNVLHDSEFDNLARMNKKPVVKSLNANVPSEQVCCVQGQRDALEHAPGCTGSRCSRFLHLCRCT